MAPSSACPLNHLQVPVTGGPGGRALSPVGIVIFSPLKHLQELPNGNNPARLKVIIATVGSRPLKKCRNGHPSGLCVRCAVPRTVFEPCPQQEIKMSCAGSVAARSNAPEAVVSASPLKNAQDASRRSLSAQNLAPTYRSCGRLPTGSFGDVHVRRL